MNDQMDAQDSYSCRNYCKAFLNDKESDKIMMITSLDHEMRFQLENVNFHIIECILMQNIENTYFHVRWMKRHNSDANMQF